MVQGTWIGVLEIMLSSHGGRANAARKDSAFVAESMRGEGMGGRGMGVIEVLVFGWRYWGDGDGCDGA